MSELSPLVACSYCGLEQPPFKFCSNCGQRSLAAVRKEEIKDKAYSFNIRNLFIYIIFSIVLLLFAALTEESFEVLLIWSICFALIDLFFAGIQPAVWGLFKLQGLKIIPLLTIFGISILTGIVVSYSVDHLNLLLFEETHDYLPIFAHLEHPLLMSLVMIAVFPAIFEELAFRGFIFNNIKALAGKKSALWGSAFLFGLVHFSLVSLIWIVPFGLLLAHYRNKHSTLIYGMVGHFTHNATTLLIEYFRV